jgi:DNA-binding response OmpR family regulator
MQASSTPDAVVVFFPAQSERLEALRLADVPRLIVVSEGQEPPALVGEHEDWMRFPAAASEVRARLDALSARAARRRPPRPSLDDHGVLHVGTAWVALSATNERLVEMLLADFGNVVPTSSLMRALQTGKRKTIRPYITRLRQSIEPLGLAVRSVRRHGYVMDFAAAS